jgi:hypothetical protein
MKPTVIITGSGVSSNYGFPIGRDLIDGRILQYLNISISSINKDRGNFIFNYETNAEFEKLLEIFKLTPDEINNLRLIQDNVFNAQKNPTKNFSLSKTSFVEQFINGLHLFKNSQIDYFLRNYSKFHELGKLLITKAMLDSELEALDIINSNRFPNENWAGCMIAKIFESVRKPEDLRNIAKNLTIITFNYDISLEYYLDLMCRGDENWEEEILNFKKNLKIIHVYGKVGFFDWEQKSIDEIYCDEMKNSFFLRDKKNGFGRVNNYDVSYQISKGIRVIDSVKNSNELKHIKIARQKILEAQKVFFLGFGFDKNNLEYLEINGSENMSFKHKEVFYTNHDNDEYIGLVINERKIKDVRHLDRNSQEVFNKIIPAKDAGKLLKLYLL